MDLLRRKLAVAAVTFADPIWVSMVASKLLDGSDAWLSCRGTIKNLQPNELHPSQFRNFLLKEERVLIDARVLGTPQSCDTALFNNNGISNHNRGFNGISSQHRINNNSSNSNRNRIMDITIEIETMVSRTIIKDQTSKAMTAIPIGQAVISNIFAPTVIEQFAHQTKDCCNKPQFSYSSNISQLHNTYDSVFITQHTPTIKTKDTERDMAFMAIANSDDLISDSGATAHMTCRKEWLFDYTPISHYSVSTATKEPHIVEGKGTLRLLSYHDGKAVPISITNVLYVPNYAVNLISECCLEEKGCTIESSKNGRIIYDKYGNVAFIANRHNKLNKLNCKIVIPIKDTIIKDKQDQSLAVSSTIKSSKTNRTIYDKYGNVALTANRHNNFNKLNRKIVIPIKGTIIKDKQDQSLAVSSTFKSPATISVWNQRLGHLSDSGIQTLTKRAQANHAKQVKSETIIPVKAIFSDNGGKFKSRDSDAFLTSKEISRQLATPHIPQQTGTAEHKNQNIMDSARSMRHYLQNILKQFQMSNYHPAATLAEVSNTLVAAQEQEGRTASPYYETVGSLIYAMIATRPDISAAISQVSKYLYYPTDTHWSAVNRILRSIKYFLNHPLTFSNNVIYLTGYYNVDWGGDLYSRRNTSGYVFFLGNSCISWRSSKQTVVALSTAEAEYVAATTATQELLFLKTFLTEIGYPINKTTTLYSDSQSAISNTKNIQLRHASNKHMDIKLHFLKDQVKLGNVNLKYINTLDQVADILIKGHLSPPSASSQIYSVCSLFASRRGVEILAVPP
ncbi:hypothetical protein BASA61_007448 [Batrachochytrium salamandrivorans]|nr:hypothetical protein BASA61_007448 [Batrachochytrium salamandrivorans]